MLAMEARGARADAADRAARAGQDVRAQGAQPLRLAQQVAEELTEHDALAAHADAEFGIDKDNLTNPWNAALASMVAFTVGAAAAAARDHPGPARGPHLGDRRGRRARPGGRRASSSARLGYSPWGRAVLRNVGGGLLAMAVTYAVGAAVGPHV